VVRAGVSAGELSERDRERVCHQALDPQAVGGWVDYRGVVSDPRGAREGVAGKRPGLVGAGKAPLGALEREQCRDRSL
jgi:hypothetical protein